MNSTETALTIVWVAAGIVAGFVVWTYVAPMLLPAIPTPAA